jgi:hypothetical protein
MSYQVLTRDQHFQVDGWQDFPQRFNLPGGRA